MGSHGVGGHRSGRGSRRRRQTMDTVAARNSFASTGVSGVVWLGSRAARRRSACTWGRSTACWMEVPPVETCLPVDLSVLLVLLLVLE